MGDLLLEILATYLEHNLKKRKKLTQSSSGRTGTQRGKDKLQVLESKLSQRPLVELLRDLLALGDQPQMGWTRSADPRTSEKASKHRRTL